MKRLPRWRRHIIWKDETLGLASDIMEKITSLCAAVTMKMQGVRAEKSWGRFGKYFNRDKAVVCCCADARVSKKYIGADSSLNCIENVSWIGQDFKHRGVKRLRHSACFDAWKIASHGFPTVYTQFSRLIPENFHVHVLVIAPFSMVLLMWNKNRCPVRL